MLVCMYVYISNVCVAMIFSHFSTHPFHICMFVCMPGYVAAHNITIVHWKFITQRYLWTISIFQFCFFFWFFFFYFWFRIADCSFHFTRIFISAVLVCVCVRVCVFPFDWRHTKSSYPFQLQYFFALSLDIGDCSPYRPFLLLCLRSFVLFLLFYFAHLFFTFAVKAIIVFAWIDICNLCYETVALAIH